MNRWLLVSILLTLLALGGPLFLYWVRPDLLKEQIPTHSNAAGEVDQWTPRERILPQWLILPAIMAKRNFWMGVRTPWTLASETVWIQTHRLTAWLWTPGGMILAILGFAGVTVWWWLGGLLLMALVPIVYSLWLYKRLEKQGRLSSAP